MDWYKLMNTYKLTKNNSKINFDYLKGGERKTFKCHLYNAPGTPSDVLPYKTSAKEIINSLIGNAETRVEAPINNIIDLIEITKNSIKQLNGSLPNIFMANPSNKKLLDEIVIPSNKGEIIYSKYVPENKFIYVLYKQKEQLIPACYIEYNNFSNLHILNSQLIGVISILER